MTPIRYYEKELILFEIEAGNSPLAYDKEYYERNASSVIKVENASDAFNELMKRVILRTE